MYEGDYNAFTGESLIGGTVDEALKVLVSEQYVECARKNVAQITRDITSALKLSITYPDVTDVEDITSAVKSGSPISMFKNQRVFVKK